jgi:oxygen-independent coproporphyrinogen-3 oxidase
VTVECNPETALPATLDGWRDTGVNRVSLGVQSLDDRDLRVPRARRRCGLQPRGDRRGVGAVRDLGMPISSSAFRAVTPQRFEASLATLAGAGVSASVLSIVWSCRRGGHAPSAIRRPKKSEAAKADLYAWASGMGRAARLPALRDLERGAPRPRSAS